MANPNANNGHIDIANELAEELMKINLSSYNYRILWLIWRKTYGWHKSEDKISLTQFQKMTGLDRWSVVRTLKKLEGRKIIEVDRESYINIYKFNSDYDKWKNSSNLKVTSHNSITKIVTNKSLKVVTNELPTKGNKETIQKKSDCPRMIFDYYCQKIKKSRVWDKKRKAIIGARLKKWTTSELKQAIDGIAKSKWNMENCQNDFELIFRNDSQVEKYINRNKKTKEVNKKNARVKNYAERDYSQGEWQKNIDEFYYKEM